MPSAETRTSSHSQQSLQRRHRVQRWLSQASFVHQTQIRELGSPQMLHVNAGAFICGGFA
jgi:hypothetical protein